MKKMFVFFVVTLLFVTNTVLSSALDITTDTSYQPDGTTNLAFGKEVSASSSYSVPTAGWLKEYLVDGLIQDQAPLGFTNNPNDDKNATETTPSWVQIDLGVKSDIKRVVLWPRQDLNPVVGWPVDYTIQISDDGTNWTTIATAENEVEVTKEPRIFDFTDVKVGRYIRVYCTKRPFIPPNLYLVQLAEMAVYGVEHQEIPPETSDSNIVLTVITLLALSSFCVKIMTKRRVYMG